MRILMRNIRHTSIGSSISDHLPPIAKNSKTQRPQDSKGLQSWVSPLSLLSSGLCVLNPTI
jgi:hypothetical protein